MLIPSWTCHRRQRTVLSAPLHLAHDQNSLLPSLCHPRNAPQMTVPPTDKNTYYSKTQIVIYSGLLFMLILPSPSHVNIIPPSHVTTIQSKSCYYYPVQVMLLLPSPSHVTTT